MTHPIWVDGEPTRTWPVDDRGLRYGDGVFETMAVEQGRIVRWAAHLARLQRGCAALGIEALDEAVLTADLARIGLPDKCVARLTVTRGSGGRGYAPPREAQPRRLWEQVEWPDFDPSIYRLGIRVAWLQSYLTRQSALAGIKHLGRTEQVLAARELETLDADDGLLCDDTGQVIEAVSANVFIRSGDTLMTPALDACGVAGVIRESLIGGASNMGFDVQVAPLRRTDLALAEEVFLTSSIRGVVPVRKLGAISLGDFRAARAAREYLSQVAE